jgi:DNA mismatch repair protein MLH1
VHPTKREVGFLNEEEIIEKISGAVQKKLGEGDSTRRFTVQTLLPGASKPIEATVVEDKGSPFPLRMRGLMGRQETV